MQDAVITEEAPGPLEAPGERPVLPEEGIDWSKVEWPEGTGRKVSLEYETKEFRKSDGD